MAEQLSSEEATKRWELLLAIENIKPRSIEKRRKRSFSTSRSNGSSGRATTSSPASHLAGDPFDCSSVAVLPTYDLVENTLHQYLKKWRQLDERKIQKKPAKSRLPVAAAQQEQTKNFLTENDRINRGACGGSSDNEVATRRTNHGGGWRAMEDRLSLPEGFDYNTKSSDQILMAEESSCGDVVVSLDDPTKILSYHSELSKLFRSIPTCRELEKEARRGHQVDNTLRLHQETYDPTRLTPDCHALSRLRAPDRHGLPQSLSCIPKENERSTGRQQNRSRNVYSGTVLLEFWRNQPKKSVSSGCHRMVMEFLASQTLWDVHVILAQMAEDVLWTAAYGDITSQDDHKNEIDYASTSGSSDGSQDKKLKPKKNDNVGCQHNHSGCFFIENVFYKSGSVDYAKPIMDWIHGDKPNHPNPIRKRYLGISPSLTISCERTMEEKKLSQIPFRLNTRYYHACHGDVETTVMLIDRKLIRRKRDDVGNCTAMYPIMHDIWTAARKPAVPLCDACQTYQSVFKTASNCKTTDGGPRSLCQECCTDLKLLENEKDFVKLDRQWHDQCHLSNMCIHERTASNEI
mmetsp:Transcript_63202/g.128800  ORF Transcript_63202/g.128800 Transcript_63202/m.128800 type:complete len:575 (-) Transcript_63202:341-2065(-)|eukprot:CAMPEP_0201213052 /NCGR_PEP_ID=MMETSP0851-20130426/185318_1 /ASSEMBLY_ACC=CAM_ASM_000631 /TAXON_ID=183588 /ORGANISM="Pseudo-nitzschia fraudulenta, Strain WWA7" /LENGTH=574 /DNA_ID=CAMNT_0047502175 /DNA_START=197 /DNA_END=1921 /DNA_ORIENTATION=+